MSTIATLLVLGLIAGAVTTIGGMGGGLLLVLVLAATTGDPLLAVAVATPALLVGNMHRVSLFWNAVEWQRIGPFMAAAAPGAFLGGAWAVAIPQWALHAALLAGAGLVVFRTFSTTPWNVPSRALAPLGFGIGIASVAGGAGPMAGPVLLSTGLSGSAYLAAMSLGATSMHVGRLAAFGAEGLVTVELVGTAAVLAGAIMGGNGLGRWVRRQLSEVAVARVEVGTAMTMVGLALLGAARAMVSG